VDAYKSVHLANIVHQGEPRTRPLYIHFQFDAQGEAVHALVNTDIGKRRVSTGSTLGSTTGSTTGSSIGSTIGSTLGSTTGSTMPSRLA